MAWPAGGFGIDELWIRRGIKYVSKIPTIFSKDSKEDAMQLLGLGNVQIDALKDWLEEANLIKKDSVNYRLTEMGEIIHNYDVDLSEDATMWVIHNNLTFKEGKAWFYYWYVNEFELNKFDREDIKKGLSGYKAYAIKHIEKYSVAPLLQTMRKTRLGKTFGVMVEDAPNQFRRIEPPEDKLDPIIVAYITMDWAERNGRSGANLIELTTLKCSPGKILHLSSRRFSEYLDKIQAMFNKEILWVSYTAGLNSVSFEKGVNPLDILKAYYIKKRDEISPLDAYRKAKKEV
jgi:hypothetical protein